jgi:uncharacterized membrane protein
MRALSGILAAAALLLASPLALGAQEPAVHAVLFYSPTCPHCHEVINNVLPPLRQKYGERLVIVGVDVTTQAGQALYQAMVAYFALPESRLGVPALVVGTDVMVGSAEIPERFPGLIEGGLAAGGIDWPPVDEIRQVLSAEGLMPQRATPQTPPENPLAPADTGIQAAAPAPAGGQAGAPVAGLTAGDTGRGPTPTGQGAAPRTPTGEAPGAAAPPPSSALDVGEPTAPGAAPPAAVGTLLSADTTLSLERPDPEALFLRDPLGNGIAVAVLAALLAVLAWSVTVMLRSGASAPQLPSWLFPLLGVAGAGIAAYLSFVEVTGATAVCGPVGDCNTVQQSGWARLFGVLPVGILGLAGYAALLAAWAAATWGPDGLRPRAWTAAWGMALVGTAFSAYLTFLEPFVIGATCAWCITSASIMALMLAAATGRAAAPPPS